MEVDCPWIGRLLWDILARGHSLTDHLLATLRVKPFAGTGLLRKQVFAPSCYTIATTASNAAWLAKPKCQGPTPRTQNHQGKRANVDRKGVQAPTLLEPTHQIDSWPKQLV